MNAAVAPLHSAHPVVTGEHGSDPRSGAGMTLPQLLFRQAERLGGATFIRKKHHAIWNSISWRDFAQDVKTLAHALRSLGLGAGDAIVVISDNLPEVYLAEYAAQCVGASATCLYPDSSADELQYILTHSAARVLFAQDQEQVDKALELGPGIGQVETIVYLDSRGLWSYTDTRLLSLDALRERGRHPSDAQRGELDASIAAGRDLDIAALCYTSGTTGQPKGVALTHRYLLDNAYRLLASLEIAPGIKYLSYISPAWGIEQIIGLGIGLLAPMVVHFSEKASTVQADLREIGVEFLLFTPRQWEMMQSEVTAAMLEAGPLRRRLVDWAMATGLRARVQGRRSGWRIWLAERLVLRALCDNLGLKFVQVALSGGSGMADEVFHRFHAMGVPLRNLYGYTEYGMISAHCGSHFDARTMGQLLRIDPAIGEPLQARLAASGELQLRGASGVCQYFRDPQATAAGLDDGWHMSGDAIRLDENRELIYLDRVKHLKRLAGGGTYPPQFIEKQLRASPYVRDVIAVGDESRPFVTVLVNIDQSVVSHFADSKGLAWRTFADLSQHPEVHALVRQALREVNAQLDEPARAVRFAAFPKELDADDGELTRSRKLRREVIEERYKALIDAMYAGAASCMVDVPVRYKDGTQGQVHQLVRIASTDKAD